MKRLLAIFAVAVLLAGCGGQTKSGAGDITITDDLGQRISVTNPPRKIVSLTPNTTEIICYLGLRDKLIGRSNYCNYPPEVKEVTSVGDPLTLSVEKILEMQPDLVVANRMIPVEIIDKMKSLGLNVAAFDPLSVDGVIDTIDRIAMICNVPSKSDELKKELDFYKKESTGKTVYIEIWNDPPTTYGKNTFGSDMVKWVGATNIGDSMEGSYPVTTNEALLALNPDIVLIPTFNSKAVDDFKIRPGFDAMKAVKDGRVYAVNEDVMSRPGPRVIDAIKLLSEYTTR